ncbi:hypothetical protein KUTeg_015891 [Tegillarca granosa]|uniref:Uncharacterized protein n=1 Tax=Tegillarca granosa TaxID=220873 RepID=A0ABQ9EJB7_TEGGR|nr:hypothetical protein KUTeg_015891 [Tegillarca granosa]
MKSLSPMIIVVIITVVLFGVNIWGLVSLKQEVDFAWFLPTDSYAYKYIQIDNQYFSSSGVRASVYCGVARKCLEKLIVKKHTTEN